MDYREKQRKYLVAFIATGMIGYTGALFAAESQAAVKDDHQAASVQTDTAATPSDTSLEAQALQDDADITDDEVDFNKDPLERINRAVFKFNDLLDQYIVKPIATFYNAVMPKPLNTGIHNFFTNVSEINNIANDILQLNARQFANDAWRFGINTTFGLAGFIDMGTRMRLPYHSNDFGLTLAKYGYQNSTYLVVPFLGPTTLRDGFGITVDYFVFSIYPYIEPQSRRFGVLGLFYIDHRANLLQFEPVLEEAAIDKYVFMRNAYMQHRRFQIEQIGQPAGPDGVIEATGIASETTPEIASEAAPKPALEAVETKETVPDKK